MRRMNFGLMLALASLGAASHQICIADPHEGVRDRGRRALREDQRMTRSFYAATGPMGPAQLDRWARQRRRSRQTKPGKRGKR